MSFSLSIYEMKFVSFVLELGSGANSHLIRLFLYMLMDCAFEHICLCLLEMGMEVKAKAKV